jgi:selenocysteine-specific elongation factor
LTKSRALFRLKQLLNAPVAAHWQRKILNTLAITMNSIRMSRPGRERLRRMALPMEDDALVLLLIENMRESGVIKATRLAASAGSQGRVYRRARGGMAKSGPLFGDEPWWVRDPRETNTDEQAMRQVLRHARSRG